MRKEQTHDLVIVPVNVYYEKSVEFKTNWQFLKNLLIGPLFGTARINFNQPFSLKVNINLLLKL